ncbi:MAG: LegC family aminotransferase [Clostridia bacterium]|nr:LegC family aminotransferase [Clostridia bacterium]
MGEIFLDAPNLGKKEKEYLLKCIDSTFVSTAGPFIREFEDKLSNYLKVDRVVSTQSGTAAIHLALHELGIGKGDEVIVPVLTFVATVNPIIYVGAKPVFVDVNINTWNIDCKKIEESVTERTRAIIPVHLYGNPCNMDDIMKISKKYNIPVIEDATESLGATYRGQFTGTFGEFGTFSFNGNKIITTGGGGAICTKDAEKANHIKFLVNQARDVEKGYYHTEIGFNYRMTNLEAALGLAQLEKLKQFIDEKTGFNDIYRKELRNVDYITFQREEESATSSFWLNSILLDKSINVEKFQDMLKQKDIPTRRIFIPIVEFPMYNQYRKSDYKNSYDIYNRGLSLPSSTLNQGKNIRHICKTIKELLGVL